MKAVVYHGPQDIRVDDVPEPELRDSTDAIVRLTATAICGTDLHFVRDSMQGTREGTILGHEGVGVVEEVGADVRNLSPGDRVVICSTIACGSCSYCRAGYFAQCDNANPNGQLAGTAFLGGPAGTGPFDGLQAEKARIPYANVTLVRLPDGVSDDQALPISDIFPTAWFGAELAGVSSGDTVAVFGCGPVGIFTSVSAFLQGATRVLAVDAHEDRLDTARRHGAETIDFEREDPVEAIRRMTGGIGTDRVIDATGVDAYSREGDNNEEAFTPGDSPAQALDWSVDAVAKAGTVAIIGVYPPEMRDFPIGAAFNKNLTIRGGNCNHRRYVPMLVELARTGAVDPATVLTHIEQITDAVSAYRAFDQRRPGWLKVELEPSEAVV